MNSLDFSAPVLLLFSCSVLAIGLAAYIFTRRRVPGSIALGALSLLIAEWSFTYGLEIASPDLLAQIFWSKFEYVAIAFIPFVWLLFALSYTWQKQEIPYPNYLYLLSLLPLITVILVFTNETHHLIWRETFVKSIGQISVLGVRYGVWFWIHFAVSYLFLFAGTALLLRELWRRKGIYRAQLLVLFFAVLLPWIGNLIFFVTPIAIDPTPFTFTFTIILMVWDIFGYRLTSLSPITRDVIVDSLREGLVVLDRNARVVDLNPAAARMIGLPAGEVIGQPIAEVMAPWPEVLARFRGVSEGEFDFSVGQGELTRQYQVRFTPLTDSRGHQVGRLMSLHEIGQSVAPAPIAERESLTQPLPKLIQQDAPDSTPSESHPGLLAWLRDFFLPPMLDEAFMPGKMNAAWEQTIERTLTMMLRFCAVFGSAAFLAFVAVLAQSAPSLLDIVSEPFIYLQALIFSVFWWISFARRLPFSWRSGALLFLVYGLTLNEVLNYGYSGEAFAFLVGFVVLSGLLLSVRGSVWASVIGLVSMGVSGFLIAAKVLQPFSVLPGTQANPTDMTAVVLSIVALTATVTALLAAVNTLKFNLMRSLAQETQMRNLLQQERDLLEQRVHERTAELREVRDQALRSRDELRTYYQVIEQSGNSIVITDLQGQITYVNPFFEKTTGYAIHEVLGKKLNILSSGHHSKEFYRRLWQTITQGEIWQGEFLNRRKDGSLYWEFATITPVKDENGQIRHYVAIKEDITAQKELRETLARQNEYLAALQNITLELLDRRGRQELLDNILQRARGALNAPLGAVMLCEQGQLVFRAVAENRKELYGKPASRELFPLAWEALEKRRPVYVEDYQAKYGIYQITQGQILHAAANFPIISGGQVLGVIALGRSEPKKPFTASQLEFGQSLAQIAALVLDNANLYESALHELEERKRIQSSLEISEQEQRALANILQIGMKEEPLESILSSALDHLLSINWLGFEATGGIFLKDSQSDTLLLTVQRSLSPEICSLCQRVQFGKCHCGRAALTRQLQFSSHVDDLHEITYEGIPDHGHYNVPILSGEQVLGVIVLYLPAGYAYDERNARFLQSFAGTLSNIIRRKKTEDLLRESEARFRQIVENASDIIYRMDERGRMTYVNPVGLRLMGYQSENEVLGKHFTQFAVPSWRPRVKAFYQRQLLKGETNTYYEFCALGKDERVIWLGQNVQIIQQSDGRMGFQAVARDITELKETQQALEEARDQALEASRFKSQLVSRISHELRTPLGGVLGYAELLHQGAFGALNAEQLDAAGNIVASANYLSLMINELLDQAQIEARAVKLHLAPFEPAAMLQSVHANMTVLSLNKGLQFLSELDPALPKLLFGDERRLQQILINLAGNAIKFTQQGQVKISLLRLNASEWAMRVSDTGAGIPKEAQAYIFEPFRQVDNSITRNNRGTGLGLSITKQLVELMGGRIELESEVGRGSTFTVILPLQEP